MKIRLIIIVILAVIISAYEIGRNAMYTDNSDDKENNAAAVFDEDILLSGEKKTQEKNYNIPDPVYENEAGYIRIEDTVIDFPVMQANDNEYYLNHSPDGRRDICGAVFMDFKADENSQNKTIYGHNMGRGRTEMFSSLVNYENTDYAKLHQKLIFRNKNGEIEEYILFAAMNFNISDLYEFDYMITDFSEIRGGFDKWAGYIYDNGFYIDGQISENDSLITLSTCSRKYGENNRLILFFRKINI